MNASRLVFALTILFVQSALAGGSISWEEVKSRISKTDPELVKMIEKSFAVSPGGGALRLGPHFGDRQGERIAPYEFGADNRKTGEACRLVIEESDDFQFTGRFKFTVNLEQEEKQPVP